MLDAYVYGNVTTARGEERSWSAADGRFPPKVGDTIRAGITQEHMHVFNPSTGSASGTESRPVRGSTASSRDSGPARRRSYGPIPRGGGRRAL